LLCSPSAFSNFFYLLALSPFLLLYSTFWSLQVLFLLLLLAAGSSKTLLFFFFFFFFNKQYSTPFFCTGWHRRFYTIL